MATRSEHDPHDPMTELAGAMLDALGLELGNRDWLHGAQPKVKAVVMLVQGEHCGLALSGYDSDLDAVPDILVQLRALLRLSGKDLAVVAMGPPPD